MRRQCCHELLWLKGDVSNASAPKLFYGLGKPFESWHVASCHAIFSARVRGVDIEHILVCLFLGRKKKSMPFFHFATTFFFHNATQL